jgi:hypothetical protein
MMVMMMPVAGIVKLHLMMIHAAGSVIVCAARLIALHSDDMNVHPSTVTYHISIPLPSLPQFFC